MRSHLFIGLAAAFSLHTGCAGERTVFHADWFPGVQFAGLYVALDRGFFAAAGLEVELVPFAFGQNAPAAIDADPATPALGSSEGYIFLQKRAGGADLCAFTAVLRESPAGIISLADHPVQSAHDFAGRIMGVHPYADGIFRWFGAQAGLHDAEYTLRTVDNDLERLARGEIDAWQGYATEELVQARRRFGPERVRFLPFRDLGFSSYAQVLYSTRAQTARHATAIASFVAALRRGWVHALAHPDDALTAVRARLDGAADQAEQREMLATLKEYVAPEGQTPLGPLDPAKLIRLQEVAQAMGLIPRVEELAAFCVELPSATRLPAGRVLDAPIPAPP